MSEAVLFGIPNCDKVRAARKWLDEKGIAWRFFDLHRDQLTTAQVEQWLEHVPLDTLLNTRSTTWRQLDENTRNTLKRGDLNLILAHPTVLKRPILQLQDRCLVGFNPEQWQEHLHA